MKEHQVLDLEHFLPYRLSVLSNTISQTIARDYKERFGLSTTEWRMMAVLGRYEGIAANELAQRTAMDKVAVSRAVARLIKVGRVKRTFASHDKRLSVLRLTTKGWEIYEKIVPQALAHERHLLGQLDHEERMWLERILTKLASSKINANE